MMNQMHQYLDQTRREETMRQAEQDRLATLTAGKNLLTTTRAQLSSFLTMTGQKLQQRYAAEQRAVITSTGTFQTVELS